MNTTPDARAGLTTAQQTVQTLLLILVSVVGTWLGFYRVPWHVSGDPCLIAATASVVIVTCLWLTRWRGSRGVILERNLLAGFLVAMPVVYVARYLFVNAGHAVNYWFWVEVLGTIIFVALAVLGVKPSPWFLAIGMVLHGLTWDTWRLAGLITLNSPSEKIAMPGAAGPAVKKRLSGTPHPIPNILLGLHSICIITASVARAASF